MNDTIFPRRSTSGPMKIRQGGVVKYGRYGEFILHVGVDEAVSSFLLTLHSSTSLR